jgi:hypothetical protein
MKSEYQKKMGEHKAKRVKAYIMRKKKYTFREIAEILGDGCTPQAAQNWVRKETRDRAKL